MTPEDKQKADDLAKAIRGLADVFIGRIPATLSNMSDEMSAIEQDPQNLAPWKTLHRHLHSVAGSAGTFGYDELGDRARELEHRINDMIKGSIVPTDEFRTTFIQDQRSFMAWVVEHYISN